MKKLPPKSRKSPNDGSKKNHITKYERHSKTKMTHGNSCMTSQSVNNKLQKIRDLTHTCKPTIVAIQETWGWNFLTDYSIKGFHPPVIQPRKGDSMNMGGGVGIWISEKTDFERINSPFVDKIIESLTIHLLTLKTIIINLYCPFGDKRECYTKLDSHLQAVTNKWPTHDLILVGDLSTDLLLDSQWTDELGNISINHNLLQQVTLPTRVTDTNATQGPIKNYKQMS